MKVAEGWEHCAGEVANYLREKTCHPENPTMEMEVSSVSSHVKNNKKEERKKRKK